MPNVAPLPSEIALNQAKKRKATTDWIYENRDKIRDAYQRVLGMGVSGKKLNEMARGNPRLIEEVQRVLEAQGYIDAYRAYSGKDPDIAYKKGDYQSKIANTFAFVDKIKATHGSLERYEQVQNAKRQVDTLDAGFVKKIGRQRLINANLGVEGFNKYVQQYDYLKGLSPLIKREFNRDATVGDVERISKRFKAVGDYESFLTAGHAARDVVSDIEGEDLGTYGANLREGQLRENIYRNQGLSGDLQRRIEEARVRRKNLFTSAKSQAGAYLNESGQIVQDLF